MQPLEPGLSFAAQKYLNYCELHLTRVIDHLARRADTELHADAKQFHEQFVMALMKFQKDVPVERRSVLHISEDGEDFYQILSTYRTNEQESPAIIATIQFERFARRALTHSSCLNATHRLQAVLAERPHLSLVCLLQPVQSLIDALFAAGWKNTVSAVTPDYVLITLAKEGHPGNEGRAIHFAVHLDNLEADTTAIKEYHAKKEVPDA